MKTTKHLLTLCLLAFCAAAVQAQILSLDFGDRTSAATLEPGFTQFLIASNTSATAVQNTGIARTIGSYTVTLSGGNGNPGYDDRLRTTPANSGDFTQELLLKDFIFATNQAGTGGLNVQIDGLSAYQPYQVVLWSFDSGSASARVSDWYAQGVRVVTNYTMAGSVAPTNNTQYQMVFKASADATGRLVIQGRRVSSSGVAVFLNALQLATTNGDPPAITSQTSSQELYAGDNAVFSITASGSPPLAYQWRQGETDITDATNATLIITNAQSGNAGDYSCQVTNLLGFGSVTSAPATLTVLPVADIRTGRMAWWPLDEITDGLTPDTTPNQFHLYASNMTSANVVAGQHDNALQFNGTDTFLMRYDESGGSVVNGYPGYTIALWVKGIGTNQLDKRVFAFSSNTNNNPMVTVGTGNPANTNAVDIYVRNDNGSAPVSHRKTTLAAYDDVWHHVAWVDNNGLATVYVDGVADTNNFNYARGALKSHITALGVVYRTNAQALFTGAIDDVAVWRRALNSNEVMFVMTNGPEVLPRFKTQPQSQLVQLTSNVTFSVVVQSLTDVGYQWYKDVTNLIADATTTSLTVSNVTLADAGGYSVVATNASGAATSAVAVLTVNRPPVAANEEAGAAQDTAANYPASKLLLHCSDPDGDTLSVSAVSATSTNSGTVSLVSGTITYTPPSGYAGADAFAYTISDGRGGTASAWVLVDVVSTNSAGYNRLTEPTWTATNTVVVSFAGIPTYSYVLRRSTNLIDWESILTNTAPANGILEFVDPAPTQPTGFYRTTPGQ